jgi:hypothetical protein
MSIPPNRKLTIPLLAGFPPDCAKTIETTSSALSPLKLKNTYFYKFDPFNLQEREQPSDPTSSHIIGSTHAPENDLVVLFIVIDDPDFDVR